MIRRTPRGSTWNMTPRLVLMWAPRAVAAFVCSALLVASAPPKGVEDEGMSGTIGRDPVGLVVRVLDHVQILSAHYSYAAKKTSIPLTGRVEGEQLVLAEPGGGVFRLRLVTKDASAPRPLSFWTATGLEGTWTKGAVSLPVMIRLEETGQDLWECAFYPPERQRVRRPHFPDLGCEHTPNRAALDACVAKPFTTDKAVVACVVAVTRSCREDQKNMNLCVANVSTYLDETIRQKLRAGGEAGRMNAAGYSRWTDARVASCKKNSEFSPDGSGYNADIDFCMSYEMTRLLQRHLVPTPEPLMSQ
jgi:hypothetical protein